MTEIIDCYQIADILTTKYEDDIAYSHLNRVIWYLLRQVFTDPLLDESTVNYDKISHLLPGQNERKVTAYLRDIVGEVKARRDSVHSFATLDIAIILAILNISARAFDTGVIKDRSDKDIAQEIINSLDTTLETENL